MLAAAQDRFDGVYHDYIDIYIALWHTLSGICTRDRRWLHTNEFFRQDLDQLLNHSPAA